MYHIINFSIMSIDCEIGLAGHSIPVFDNSVGASRDYCVKVSPESCFHDISGVPITIQVFIELNLAGTLLYPPEIPEL